MMTNDELLDSAESDATDLRWALRQLTDRLPHHCIPGVLELDVGRLLGKLAQLRKDCAGGEFSEPKTSGSDERISR